MAAVFDTGGSDVLAYAHRSEFDDAGQAAFSFWLRPDVSSGYSYGGIISQLDNADTDGFYIAYYLAPSQLAVGTRDSFDAQSITATCASAFTTSVWQHVFIDYNAGIANNEVRAWVNGSEVAFAGAGGARLGATMIGANSASFTLGKYLVGATSYWAPMGLAEVGIWAGYSFIDTSTHNLRPGALEVITALAAGYSPLLWPERLSIYAPLVRDFQDMLNGAPTNTGVTVDDHIRVIYPSTARRYPSVSTPVSPIVIPRAITPGIAFQQRM